MSRLFNFFKKLFQGTTDEVQSKEKTEEEEKFEEQHDKESGIIRRSFTDELGSYERIRTANDGVELWQFRSGNDCNSIEINAPAADFKTVKKFVNYIKEEIERV
jgi:hypothetical protein